MTSSNPLSFNLIESNEYVDSTLSIIKKRAEGQSSIPLRWPSLNDMLMAGIEPGALFTIAGKSGAGKSALANMIEDDIIQCPNMEVLVINFSLEMSAEAQIMRKLSASMGVSTRKLKSADGILDEKTMRGIEAECAILKGRCKPLLYYTEQLSVEHMEAIMRACVTEHFKDRWVVFFIDHVGLIKGFDERRTLTKLEAMLTEIKKLGKTTIIQLAQLNRLIEAPQRKSPLFHFPNRSDIMASDSLYQASDYVMVIHRPEQISGIRTYGPNNLPVRGKVYIHILKNREGEEKVLAFNNEFFRNNMTEDIKTTEIEAGGCQEHCDFASHPIK